MRSYCNSTGAACFPGPRKTADARYPWAGAVRWFSPACPRSRWEMENELTKLQCRDIGTKRIQSFGFPLPRRPPEGVVNDTPLIVHLVKEFKFATWSRPGQGVCDLRFLQTEKFYVGAFFCPLYTEDLSTELVVNVQPVKRISYQTFRFSGNHLLRLTNIQGTIAQLTPLKTSIKECIFAVAAAWVSAAPGYLQARPMRLKCQTMAVTLHMSPFRRDRGPTPRNKP